LSYFYSWDTPAFSIFRDGNNESQNEVSNMMENQVPKRSRRHSNHTPQARTTEREPLYLLGHSENEASRLRRQAEELRPESAWLFDRLKLSSGDRAIDLGCGPQGVLDLLSERVGLKGSVVGVEKNDLSVEIAKRFVADRKFNNVEVMQGDATATGLPGASFDLVHARFVLVNVPNVEEAVYEMTRLARPGGLVVSHEADYLSHFCDPPLPAWDRLFEVFEKYSSANGIDLFVGRRTHRLLRDAGLIDIEVNPIIRVFPHGHNRRMIFWDFLQNVRDRILEQKLIDEPEFDELTTELKEYLDRPNTLVVSHLFFQVWGRKPM
jgi:SAM-dependent methyltransferase